MGRSDQRVLHRFQFPKHTAPRIVQHASASAYQLRIWLQTNRTPTQHPFRVPTKRLNTLLDTLLAMAYTHSFSAAISSTAAVLPASSTARGDDCQTHAKQRSSRRVPSLYPDNRLHCFSEDQFRSQACHAGKKNPLELSFSLCDVQAISYGSKFSPIELSRAWFSSSPQQSQEHIVKQFAWQRPIHSVSTWLHQHATAAVIRGIQRGRPKNL